MTTRFLPGFRMATPPAAVLLTRLAARTAPTAPDADLLARFLAGRDEAAFAELVRRHGPTVYRVCRRLVGPAAAEDAFQATFLILATRAKTVRKAGSVGSWLIGVAGRVARQMRSARRRREHHEQASGETLTAQRVDPFAPDLAEQFRILDEELTRLPDRLRDPVVACLLDGRTYEQAAAELGGSVRTVRRRLDEAKRVLRLRLERRGIVPAVAAGLAAGVGEVATAIPGDLGRRTVAVVFDFLAGGAARTAAPAVLAKGVATAMIARKLTVLMTATAVGLTAVAVGVSGAGSGEGPGAEGSSKSAPPIPATRDRIPPQDLPQPVPPPSVKPLPQDDTETRFTTDNFAIDAPTPELAQRFGNAAERYRREKSIEWLGTEIPRWQQRCPVKVSITPGQVGGATTFTFGKDSANRPVVVSQEMRLFGSIDPLLTNTLPHEITHTILAHHFGQAVPRWADEGIAMTAESDSEQRNHAARCREILNQGRGIPLRHLFRMKEYPRDMIVLMAQGHSVCQFLLTRKPNTLDLVAFEGGSTGRLPLPIDPSFAPQGGLPASPKHGLLTFVAIGMHGDWDKAAREVYGYNTVDDLEEAWLAWLRQSEPPPPPRPVEPVPPPVEPVRLEDKLQVVCANPAAARAVQAELLFQYRHLGKRWFGAEQPPGKMGYILEVSITNEPYRFLSSTVVEPGRLELTRVSGRLEEVLENAVPPCVIRSLLSTRQNPRLPAWLIGGIVSQVSPADRQAALDQECRQMLDQGQGVRLKAMFVDNSPIPAAQCHSVVRFLDSRKEPAAVVRFSEAGPRDGWDRAAKDVFGFKSVDAMEAAWIEWLKSPVSRITKGSLPTGSVEGERIPPVKVEPNAADPFKELTFPKK